MTIRRGEASARLPLAVPVRIAILTAMAFSWWSDPVRGQEPQPAAKPIPLIKITDSDGQTIAQLYILGSDVAFDQNQRVVKGAGYIEALPGKRFSIVGIMGIPNATGDKLDPIQQIQLFASRLEWTADGSTVEVRGLAPEVRTSLGRRYEIAVSTGATLDSLRPVNGKIRLQVVGRGEIGITLRFDRMLSDVDGAQHLFEKADLAKK